MKPAVICRICLVYGIKSFSTAKYQELQEFYEALTRVKIEENDVLDFCYECAHLLRNFNEFREKCFRGKYLLNRLINPNENVVLSINTLTEERIRHKLMSRLCNNTEDQVAIHVKSDSCNDDEAGGDSKYVSKEDKEIKRMNVLPLEENLFDNEFDNSDTLHYEVPFNSHKMQNGQNKSAPVNNNNDINLRTLQPKQDNKPIPYSVIKDVKLLSKLTKLNDSSNINVREDCYINEDIKRKKDESYKKAKYRCGICFSHFSAFVDLKNHALYHDTVEKAKKKLLLQQHSTVPTGPIQKENFATLHKRKRELLAQKRKDKDVGYAIRVHLSWDEQLQEMRQRKDSENGALKFKCDTCFQGFIDEYSLERHLLKHDASHGEFECPLCFLRYKSKYKWHSHRLHVHEQRYFCKVCKHVSCNTETAKSHYKLHKGFVHRCQHCSATYDITLEYQKHIQIHGTVLNKCGVCSVRAPDMKEHLQLEHAELLKPVSESYCLECDVEFDSTQAFDLHRITCSTHNGDSVYSKPCALCGHSFEDNILFLSHANSHQSAPMACEQCNMVFLTPHKLKIHVRCKHSVKKTVPMSSKHIMCESCGLCFKSRHSLVCHQRWHTGDKPYECDTCHRRFVMASHLKIHIRIHTGEKPYSCAICRKSFRIMKSLQQHSYIHTGAKPYLCNICGKGFIRTITMKNHIKSVHMQMPTKQSSRIEVEIK